MKMTLILAKMYAEVSRALIAVLCDIITYMPLTVIFAEQKQKYANCSRTNFNVIFPGI